MNSRNLSVNKFVWGVVFLFPVMPHVLGAPAAQKLIHVFALAFIIVSLLIKPVTFDKRSIHVVITIVSSFIIYYASLSLFMTEKLTFSDLPDFIRPLVYLLYIAIPFIYPLNKQEWPHFFSFFKKMFILQIIISALVYIPVLWPLVDLFKGRPSDDMPLHFYRWSGTYGYPSDFSFYLSFFVYYYFSFFARRIKIALSEWLIVLIALIAMFLSFSRGGIFSTIGILGLAFWFTGARKRKSAYLILSILIVIITAAIITFSEQFVQVAYILETFGGEDGNVDDSTSHRLKEIQLAWQYLTQFPPFSFGSNRVELADKIEVIESFYGYHLIKWGILGLFAIVIVKLSALFCCLKVYLRESKLQTDMAPLAFAVACLIAAELLLFGLSSAISDRFKTLPTFYLLLGYVLYGYIYRGGNEKRGAEHQ